METACSPPGREPGVLSSLDAPSCVSRSLLSLLSLPHPRASWEPRTGCLWGSGGWVVLA